MSAGLGVALQRAIQNKSLYPMVVLAILYTVELSTLFDGQQHAGQLHQLRKDTAILTAISRQVTPH